MAPLSAGPAPGEPPSDPLGAGPARGAPPATPVKVAYLVSRFPSLSETFVLRELDAVAADPRLAVGLRCLFPPQREAAVHPAARAWIPRLGRPGPGAGLRALAGWALRRPGRLAGALAAVLRAYARVPRVLPRALATVPLACAHARALEASGCRHVHAHFATYPALAAWVAWRLTGIPYSFTAHAHDLFVHQAMLARKAHDAAFVVAISDFHRRFLLDHAPHARVELVHCGVHPAHLPAPPRRLAASGPVRGLCVAALRDYKGHAVLLRALAGAGPLERLELDLVGDGELRASLAAMVAELGLAARVRFHGGLPEPRVVELLAAADLFVLPSVIAPSGDMEGVPIALMEALACALPTVATRQSGIPELVRDGETGWLAQPGDVPDLRRALAAALADPAQAAQRGRAGRRLVEAEYDQATSARRLADLLVERARRAGAGDG